MKPFLEKYFIIVISIFVIGLAACYKSNNNPIYLNTNLINYFDYHDGSYWTFYDSLNNNLDTFTVYEDDTISPYINGSTPNQYVYIDIHNTHYTVDVFIDLVAQVATQLSLGNYKGGDIQYSLLTNNIPFDTGAKTINVNYNYRCNYLQNFNVNNIVYNNVYKIEITDSIYQDVFYINADAGFIEILFNDQLFHKQLYLVSYNIIK